MKLPRISIITVTYNAEKTLRRTLDSVERQTMRLDIEHIIMDGASTDSTLRMAEEYQQRNPDMRIHVRSERDHGLYDAMNKALGMATGDFVCFLNAGDKLHANDTLQAAFAATDNIDETGILYGDTDIVDIDGRFISKRHLTPPRRLTSRSFKQGMLVCHQSFYARRTLCPNYDLRYRFSADVDWCINVMKEGEQQSMRNVHTGIVLTDYLSEGVTTKNHRASLKERFVIMTRHYGLFTTIFHHFLFLFRQ